VVAALSLTQLAAYAGREAQALSHARSAHALCVEHAIGSLVHVAQYLEGLIEGGPVGDQKRQTALGEISALGWVKPLSYIGMMAPLVRVLGTPDSKVRQA
jgi:hypothetical protein